MTKTDAFLFLADQRESPERRLREASIMRSCVFAAHSRLSIEMQERIFANVERAGGEVQEEHVGVSPNGLHCRANDVRNTKNGLL